LNTKVLILAISLFLASCASSYVYSPSLMLPSKPLMQNDVRASIGVEQLNESRPNAVYKINTPGVQANLNYAFTNYISMQGKGWFDLYKYESGNYRSGCSLSATILLNDSTNAFRYALIPTYGLSFSTQSPNRGQGVGIWFAAWFPTKTIVKPYAASAIAAGAFYLSSIKDQFGYGLIINLGTAIELTPKIDLNVELPCSFIHSRYDMTNYFILSPAVALSYKF